jgi:hypothetical protein
LDAERFDRLARTLSGIGSRRAALAALLSAAGALHLADPSRTLAQGCLPNGAVRTAGAECCSGRCKHKTCRQAPNQGLCTVEWNECAGNSRLGSCVCFVTIKGRSFCGHHSGKENPCGCASHMECRRRFGKDARCVESSEFCNCPAGTTTTCAERCPELFSSPLHVRLDVAARSRGDLRRAGGIGQGRERR